MLLYVITDRRLRPDRTAAEIAVEAASCGADMLQIREKDLTTRELVPLVAGAVEAAQGGTEVYVNGRPEVALAAGARGVHLPADGLPPDAVVARWGGRLRVGVSTHGIDEVRRASDSGADFVVFGPVFETASKRSYGAPRGLGELAAAARAAAIPVLAIGGVTPPVIAAIAGTGAAGVAVVSAVVGAPDMKGAVQGLRAIWGRALPPVSASAEAR